MTDIIIVRNEQATGVDGGTSSDTTDHIRVLNTEVLNTIDGASLAANRVTLPAGTYDIYCSAAGYRADRHRAILYNVTDTAIELLGPGGSLLANADNLGGYAFVMGRIVITGEKVFELQHYIQSGFATFGLGVAMDDGRVEVYSEFIAQKIA